ncbi:hypothetical protein T440DRAFT_46451 [Plenodomus tracheiphilus IPT5]|uniref:Uncharacterized protein n=1 Tax=Plenodomus tracheiphilus IPT5 TaxID=1408161 RepID=A0A6A7B927_9PLEO|nr:hypothetical protein T440DRAFT_46451 [Plenodomus tracheiphilus IPT5]
MAGSDSGSSGADLPFNKSEDQPTVIDSSTRFPRRLLTLVTITILLNTLLWSSIICLAVSIYQIVSDPNDVTSIAPVVLTSTSALATVAYTIIHTVFSFKQKTWSLHQQHLSAIKKTDYVAVRMVVALCSLWLLTTGWNMIIVARRPLCEQSASGLQAWEYGPRCYVSRVGIAFAVIALVASCILFGVLATVRRPFEAHLLRFGLERPHNPLPTLLGSRKSSPTRRASFASEKHPLDHRRSVSAYTAGANFSIPDGDALDWNFRPPAATIHAPSPVRSLGLGIFTSGSIPPPIPSAYATLPRLQPLGTFAPLLYPWSSQHSLTVPPRLSGDSRNASFASSIVPAEYSASTMRALHPPQSAMGLASRSQQHLPSVGFAYHKQYSRSTVSLTRPHRLGTVTPAGSVDWSSRSGSTGPEQLSSLSSAEGGTGRNKTAPEVAETVQHSSLKLESDSTVVRKAVHTRTASAPASDAVCGADAPQQINRMAMGWKPQLAGQTDLPSQSKVDSGRNKPSVLTQSTSAGFLSSFSPDISPSDDDATFSDVYGDALNARKVARKPLPIRRSSSAGAIRLHADATTGAVDPAEAAAVMLSRMPKDIRLQGRRSSGGFLEGGQKKAKFEDVKNKPLPRIAIL